MTRPGASVPLIDLAAQRAALEPGLTARLTRVLADGRFVLGPEVAELEGALARFAGVGNALCVANGTEALKIPLMALGIGPGDAVFVPAFTFVATAEVVAELGASPVFVDIEPAYFCLDPADLERRIAAVRREGHLRPRAVIPVDLFGQPADYEAIHALAAEHDLFVLADAAQSFGAARQGSRIGGLAPVTATSFYPSKPLGCYGDGGAILTDDTELADQLRSIARHGLGADGFRAERVGLNSRLDTLQAAILLAKLEVFAAELTARARAAEAYHAALGSLVETPALRPGNSSAWAVYSVLTDRRDALRAALTEAAIATAVYYPAPLHLHPAYRSYGGGPGSLPVSESIAERILALPMHGYLEPDTIARIASVVRAALA